jgi:hypothetical protein
MTTEDIIKQFNKTIDTLIASNSEALVDGCADDYAAYTGLVGRIRGLTESKLILGEAIDNWLNQDREDD